MGAGPLSWRRGKLRFLQKVCRKSVKQGLNLKQFALIQFLELVGSEEVHRNFGRLRFRHGAKCDHLKGDSLNLEPFGVNAGWALHGGQIRPHVFGVFGPSSGFLIGMIFAPRWPWQSVACAAV